MRACRHLQLSVICCFLSALHAFRRRPFCSRPALYGMDSSGPTCPVKSMRTRKLPTKIIGGYASWDASKLDEHKQDLFQTVNNGVNVIFWFSIDLATDASGAPTIISRGPSREFVARFAENLQSRHSESVTHLITIGGWNAKHPTTSNTVEEVYAAWKHWNEITMADTSRGFHGFDGFDWDIEGHDDVNSPNNHFTMEVLDMMGRFSQLAKRDGYIVSMAPMESYLDPTTSDFNRSCRLTNPEWQPIVPAFTYHGRNVYAYLLARYGRTSLPASEASTGNEEVDTFDMIVLQLYESYSHFGHAVGARGEAPSDALARLARALRDGWRVNFSADPALGLPDTTVSVPPSRLVFGLANAWAQPAGPPPHKTLFVRPRDLAAGYAALARDGAAPRGFAFWSAVHEGDALRADAGGPAERLFLAAELREVLAAGAE